MDQSVIEELWVPTARTRADNLESPGGIEPGDELVRNFNAVVSASNGDTQEWQRGNLKDPIDVAVASDPIRPLVRGIIQFHRGDW